MSNYIERNKNILGGSLVIKGTRVPISRIIFLIARGKSIKNIIKKHYPFLSISNTKQALEELAEGIDD